MKYLLILLLIISINGFGQRIDTFKKGDLILYERYDPDGYVDSIWSNRPSGGNHFLNNLVISGSETYPAFFVQVKHQQSKTDTVKGFVNYYKRAWLYGMYGAWQLSEKAIAIYEHHTEYVSQNTGTYLINLPKKPIEVRKLIKIISNGKEFDLSKKYEFITNDEVVK